MVKLTSPFRVVTCPVCGSRINCTADKSILGLHIGDKHPTASIKNLIKVLLRELKLSTPENIDEVNNEELNKLLANLCLYKATKSGLDDLRREIRGK